MNDADLGIFRNDASMEIKILDSALVHCKDLYQELEDEMQRIQNLNLRHNPEWAMECFRRSVRAHQNTLRTVERGENNCDNCVWDIDYAKVIIDKGMPRRVSRHTPLENTVEQIPDQQHHTYTTSESAAVVEQHDVEPKIEVPDSRNLSQADNSPPVNMCKTENAQNSTPAENSVEVPAEEPIPSPKRRTCREIEKSAVKLNFHTKQIKYSLETMICDVGHLIKLSERQPEYSGKIEFKREIKKKAEVGKHTMHNTKRTNDKAKAKTEHIVQHNSKTSQPQNSSMGNIGERKINVRKKVSREHLRKYMSTTSLKRTPVHEVFVVDKSKEVKVAPQAPVKVRLSRINIAKHSAFK